SSVRMSIIRSLSVLLCTVLVVLAMSGSEAKNDFVTCCTTVSNKEIPEPILGYLIQRANRPCVNAVVFQTQSGVFCINGRAPWVRAKIVAFDIIVSLCSCWQLELQGGCLLI
uniref:Chemokine interleukin-8-like domain-containing protein n=1 Tax=Maylandia zebra TaxID=106582 RepID=A0A3P9CXU9_9CICH